MNKKMLMESISGRNLWFFWLILNVSIFQEDCSRELLNISLVITKGI